MMRTPLALGPTLTSHPVPGTPELISPNSPFLCSLHPKCSSSNPPGARARTPQELGEPSHHTVPLARPLGRPCLRPRAGWLLSLHTPAPHPGHSAAPAHGSQAMASCARKEQLCHSSPGSEHPTRPSEAGWPLQDPAQRPPVKSWGGSRLGPVTFLLLSDTPAPFLIS